MRTKYKKVNKITPLYTLNLKVILQINMGAKYRKENTNNTILYTKCRSYITLYNTFSIYDSVNENTNNSIIYTKCRGYITL